jgi:hypothetical protein
MITIQKLIAGICIIALPFFIACGKDDPATCDYATEVQDELNAVNAAATTYGNNPTTENCNAFKAAYQNYLNELQDHDNCVLPAQQAQYQDAIDQAQASLDALQC